MSFSYSAGVITQTGTDTSLAGLNGLTGVTRTQSDRDSGASNWYTIYTIDAATQLRVTGTLTIDPDIESLIIEGEAAGETNAPFYVNGGTVNFGVARTGNGNTIYSEGIGLQFTKEGANFFNVDGLYVDGTGTWIWNGGIIRSAATITFGDGATLTVNSGTFFSVATVNTMQLRCEANDATASSKINIYNLILAGLTGPSRIFTLWAFGTAVFTLKRGEFQPLNPMDTPITLTDFNNGSNVNDADIAFETQNGNNARTITVQNAFQEVITRDINGDRYGYVEVFRQLDSPIVDLNGSSISYSYYGVDTNNGNRGVGAAGQDRTADEVYSGINATGNLSENILVSVIRDISGIITVDDRTDASGNITIRVIGYGENIAAFNPTLYGIGSNTETAILTPDLIITESVKATVDAYTSIDTAQQLYDRAKSYLYDNYAGEAAPIVGRSGEQILLEGKTLTIDGTAVSAFAYADPAITIHSDTFTGGATATTGSVTTVNGALLDGGTFDCDVNYQSGAGTTLNDITVNGTLDFSVAGTYTLNGCTISEVTNSSGGAVTLVADASTTITTNTGPNITISAPVLTLTVNSSETGSLIQVFNTGTQTILASATSNTLAYEHSNQTVDIVVQKAGFIPQRQTGVDLTGISTTISIELVSDLNYDPSHGLTYTTDASWNRLANTLTVPTFGPTGQGVYSLMIDSFISQSSLFNTDFNLAMNGPQSLIFTGDAEGATDGDIENLTRCGVEYRSSADIVTAAWTGVLSSGVLAGSQPHYHQVDGDPWVATRSTGDIDELIKVFGDSTHGNFDYRDTLDFKVNANGDRPAEVDVMTTFGISTLEPVLYVISLAQTEIIGLTLGDPAPTGLSITDNSGAPVSWDAGDGLKNYSITITDTGSNSGETILRWVNYNTAQAGTPFQGDSAYDWPEMVLQVGSNYETIRGTFHKAGGDVLAGVRVVDGAGDPHPDFARFQADDGTYGTPPAPATSYGLLFTGLVAGSSVRIFNTGTQTLIDNNESTGTSYEWNVVSSGTITVDYTIQQAGYLPIRVTGVVLTATVSGSTSISVQQTEDLVYQASSGLTFGTTATVNTGTKEVTVSAATTTRNWYSFMIESWINETALYNEEFPFSTNGPASIYLNDGWEWGDGATSIAFLSRNGFRYLDGAGTTTAIYAALQTPTLPAATKVWSLQVDGGSWSLLTTGTEYDGIVQVFGDATHGNFDYTDFLTLKATGDGYTESEWNVLADGGVSSVVDSFYFVPLDISPTGEATGDPGALGITVNNIVDTLWNGITVGAEVVVDGGITGSQVLRYITWQKHQGNLLNFGQLVLPNGNDYQSVRGRVTDGTPLEVEGTRVVLSSDGTTPHPDFTLFEGDSGTYTPPVSVTGTVTFTQTGSRVQIYNVTTATELYNAIPAGTSAQLIQNLGSSTYWSNGDTIRIRVTYQNGLTATQKESTTVTVGSSEEWSTTITQETCPTYDSYGIDGSTVTEFAWDNANVQFDINDPDNTWYVSRLFAWDKYYTFTEAGIRDAFEYISAVDAGNIQIDNAAALDNLKAQTAIQGDQVRLFRPNGTLPVVNPTTGGGGFTFYSTGTIYTITSGSGVTAQDKTDIINGVWGYLIETGFTAVETQRIITAALAGKLSGADGTTITIRDILDTKARIVATVDANGNRTAVTLDGS